MEILPGAFEQEWERRRAAILHEMQLGQRGTFDWDAPRKGGVARLPDEGIGGFGRARRRVGGGQDGWARGGTGAAGRSMRTRFGVTGARKPAGGGQAGLLWRRGHVRLP